MQSFVVQLLIKETIMIAKITRPHLAEKVLAGRAVLVEALPEKYFADWHLPGARHMPHDQVDALAPRVLPEKDAEIVVYCANAQCQNSHIAAHTLMKLGYRNVSVYAEGKKDWIEAELPVERGAQRVVETV
jgi:rhodanese-related sulfurtransferase